MNTEEMMSDAIVAGEPADPNASVPEPADEADPNASAPAAESAVEMASPSDIGDEKQEVPVGQQYVPLDAQSPGDMRPQEDEPVVEYMQPLDGDSAAAASGSGHALEQQYIQFDWNGKVISLQVKGVAAHPFDSDTPGVGLAVTKRERAKTVEELAEEKKVETIFSLLPDSTNAWLYVVDDATVEESDGDADGGGCLKACASCSDNLTNKLIAFFVIMVQIAGYITMTVFLISFRNNEAEDRRATCYGPNCNEPEEYCMNFGTGGLTSVLLVGFLWADFVNTVFITFRNWRWFGASLLVMAEILTAIVCGYFVGVYSESDFDAIGGAVGILFVHDLDEKVFASMQVFRGRSASCKKALALILWIAVSISVALAVSCSYIDPETGNSGLFAGECKTNEFQCGNGECIWGGFVCNGIEDCRDASDEGTSSGCVYSALTMSCPFDAENNQSATNTFLCVEDGSCIDYSKRCDGILDCPEGSDEGREQNCIQVIELIKCSGQPFTISDKYPNTNNTYHKNWNGTFKCNNGQCIDARFACDGVADDCVDGSDEYPFFDKSTAYPFLKSCPYPALVECPSEQLLCKVDGQCITKDRLCDGTPDCVDGSDEKGCEYDCKSRVMLDRRYQCGGLVARKVNDTHLALHNNDSYSTEEFSLVAYTKQDTKTGTNDTFSQYFEGQTGECIPISWRCDGVKDCENGDDEKACKLFTCGDDYYACPDTGKCIPKAWLCDGTNDCSDKSDEEQSVCLANGVSISTNACGNQYSCKGSSGICVVADWMCDDYQDCPQNDDEEQANCDAFEASYVPPETVTLTCGETATGDAYQYNEYPFTFTLPAEYGAVKMSTCLTDHQGPSYLYLTNADYTQYVNGNHSEQCQCAGRFILAADTTNIARGEEYTVTLYTEFTGTYAIKVDCDASSLAAITTSNVCTDTYTGGSSGSSGYYGGYDYGSGGYDYGSGYDYSGGSSGYDTDSISNTPISLGCGVAETGTLAVGEALAFSWIQSGSVDVSLNGCASDFDTVFTVHVLDSVTGESIQVGVNDDDTSQCPENQSYLPVLYDPTFSGSTYVLTLTGYGDSSGFYSITLEC